MTPTETEFARSIRLLNRLNGDESARAQFESDPEAVLQEFGINGEEGDRFKDRWVDGELRVLGWRITENFRILSPWPMNAGDREVRQVDPNPITVNVDTELVIHGQNLRLGDRVGFRRQSDESTGKTGGTDPDFESYEAHEIEFVTATKIIACVNIPSRGTYDVAVGRLASAGFLNGGLQVD